MSIIFPFLSELDSLTESFKLNEILIRHCYWAFGKGKWFVGFIIWNPFIVGEITIPSYPDKKSIADIITGDKKKRVLIWKQNQPSVFMIDMNIFGVK